MLFADDIVQAVAYEFFHFLVFPCQHLYYRFDICSVVDHLVWTRLDPPILVSLFVDLTCSAPLVVVACLDGKSYR